MCESLLLSIVIVSQLNIRTSSRLYVSPHDSSFLHLGDHHKQAVCSRTAKQALTDAVCASTADLFMCGFVQTHGRDAVTLCLVT